ncbi:MAG: hypothetical protein KF684_06600 [Phycisphaeraceae bacterium]|nr:hypothetical protein [Phycisphaeraceae bacterium]
MKARKRTPAEITGEGAPAPSGQGVDRAAKGRVLVHHPCKGVRARVIAALRECGMVTEGVASLRTARAKLAETVFDAALLTIRGDGTDALDLANDLSSDAMGPGVVMLSDRPDVDDAVRAMRAGAMDLLSEPYQAADVALRVRAVVDAARRDRQREEQLSGLKKLCRELNTARDSVTKQVGSLCDELADAYTQITEQVQHVKAAAEFAALIRQDLDVESALRTCLEYLLTKTGPTNAAVFLPGDHGDFSLGAYVNYDRPRDAADVLLDHLANTLAPRFADEDSILAFDGEEDLAKTVGDDAHWLGDSRVVVIPCSHDEECMAVMVLFRDRLSPFSTDAMPVLEIVGRLFAEQLDRVVRVHGRAFAKDEAWPDEDIGGMAA